MQNQTSLPLAYNWNVASGSLDPNNNRPDTQWISDQMNAGRSLFPHMFLRPEKTWESVEEYVTIGVQAAKAHGTPVWFRMNNLFWDLKRFSEFSHYSINPDDYEDHPWHVEVNSNGLNTNTRLLSMWSPLSMDVAFQLGFLIATCPTVVGAMNLYPECKLPLFADNDEVGLDWKFDHPEVREPSQFTNWTADLQIDCEKARKAIHNEFLNQQKLLTRELLLNQFQKGWQLGLRDTPWEGKANWQNFSSYFQDYSGGKIKLTASGAPGSPVFDRSLSIQKDGLEMVRHAYGSTGAEYQHAWFASPFNTRTWGQISNARAVRDLTDNAYGVKGPIGSNGVRSTLAWEAKDRTSQGELIPRMDREQWRGWLTCLLWISHAGSGRDHTVFGHFSSSQTRLDEPEMFIYYDEAINVCTRAAQCDVSDYWKRGTLIEGLEGTPYQNDKPQPLTYRTPWYFQYVPQVGRYASGVVPSSTVVDEVRPVLQELPRSQDPWRQDLTNRQPFPIATWAMRLDDKILLFACGTEVDQGAITVRLPVDNVIVDYNLQSCPVGGQFYEIDLTTGIVSTLG